MILAIDTATHWIGLALHDGQTLLAEHGWRASSRHTVELAPAVARMWRQTGVSNEAVKGIAVAIGPGSYTGLRIGLAFAKGLALTLHIPLMGVPTLDILAAALPILSQEIVLVAEAGRTRVCAATYKSQARKRWHAEAPPVIMTWDKLLSETAEQTTFAGEISTAAARQIKAAHKKFRMAPAATSARRAGYLAEIGWQRFKRNRVDNAAELTPVYLRDPAGA